MLWRPLGIYNFLIGMNYSIKTIEMCGATSKTKSCSIKKKKEQLKTTLLNSEKHIEVSKKLCTGLNY